MTPVPQGNTVPVAVYDYKEFTTSGTWTKPAGCNMVFVEVLGGGGGGGKGHTDVTGRGGGGGGGGGYMSAIMPASILASTETITIAAAALERQDGNYSAFGSFLKATGGKKGSDGTASTVGAAGAGGAGLSYAGTDNGIYSGGQGNKGSNKGGGGGGAGGGAGAVGI
jgi:hypothetical protein